MDLGPVNHTHASTSKKKMKRAPPSKGLPASHSSSPESESDSESESEFPPESSSPSESSSDENKNANAESGFTKVISKKQRRREQIAKGKGPKYYLN